MQFEPLSLEQSGASPPAPRRFAQEEPQTFARWRRSVPFENKVSPFELQSRLSDRRTLVHRIGSSPSPARHCPRRRWLRDQLCSRLYGNRSTAMFQTHNPNPTVAPPIALTLCPVCGEAMRISVSKPSPHYKNIAERTYLCDACGDTENYVYRKD
jgi:hypothetical protein